ncbi:uncharacterized protein DS421_17g577380 [Arachis hypogaea]|nr:uncharacterized protein DS421_17g577380 [Arachis hypogaea]
MLRDEDAILHLLHLVRNAIIMKNLHCIFFETSLLQKEFGIIFFNMSHRQNPSVLISVIGLSTISLNGIVGHVLLEFLFQPCGTVETNLSLKERISPPLNHWGSLMFEF